MKKRIFTLFLCCLMVFISIPTTIFAEEYVSETSDTTVASSDTSASKAKSVHKETGSYFKGLMDKATPSVSSIGGEWMVIGLARSGYAIPSEYFANVASYVKENIDVNGRLHSSKSTDNARVILGLTAAGYDPRNVGGYNLLNGLTDMDYVKKQGINGPIWALIALDSHNYEIPSSSAENVVTREKLVTAILEAQLTDYGWAISGDTADSDMTGMALQALAPYYSSNSQVKTAVDNALTKLSSMQESDGSYATVGTVTSESISQIIVALTALGIDPTTDSRFIKNGCSVVDALLSFAVDGGGFEHIKAGGIDGMASEQGYYALTSYVRMSDNKTSLYNMTDVTLSIGVVVTDSSKTDETPEDENKKAVQKVEILIDAIGAVTTSSETSIKKARNAYKNLTDEQKALVSNYQDLVDAETALKEAKIAYVENLIDAIGTTSLSSKAKINYARTAYNNLSRSLQKKISNLYLLETAEAEYKELLEQSKTTSTSTTGTTSTNQNSTSKKSTAAVSSDSIDTTKTSNTPIQKLDELLEGVKEEVLQQEILDVILAYEDLTVEEKKSTGKASYIEALKERVAELIQTDRKTGISISDVDWNVSVVVNEILDIEQMKTMQTLLDGTQILASWDFYLENVITGQNYEPTGTVSVKIPLSILGDYTDYDGLTVVHIKDDGTKEYLNCMIVGNYLVFNTIEFSNYVISAYHGSSPIEALMEGAPLDDSAWISWVIVVGIFGGLFIVVLCFYIFTKKKSENQSLEQNIIKEEIEKK